METTRHHLIEPIIGGKTPDHLVIAVDFDGTICQHPGKSFPAIGAPVPHALAVLHRIQEAGHKIILLTMRDSLTNPDAVAYLTNAGINLYCTNYNPDVRWSMSRKVYAHIYIDDAALGCPMVRPSDDRAYVNWREVELWLEEQGVLIDLSQALLEGGQEA